MNKKLKIIEYKNNQKSPYARIKLPNGEKIIIQYVEHTDRIVVFKTFTLLFITIPIKKLGDSYTLSIDEIIKIIKDNNTFSTKGVQVLFFEKIV